MKQLVIKSRQTGNKRFFYLIKSFMTSQVIKIIRVLKLIDAVFTVIHCVRTKKREHLEMLVNVLALYYS